VQRVDPVTGNPSSPSDPPTVNLGGNTVSAIANASGVIPGAALKLIYSTALGGFDSPPSSKRCRKSRCSTSSRSRA
jgi:hypothetical protein